MYLPEVHASHAQLSPIYLISTLNCLHKSWSGQSSSNIISCSLDSLGPRLTAKIYCKSLALCHDLVHNKMHQKGSVPYCEYDAEPESMWVY